MAYQKLQSGSGLSVIPSDTYNIPSATAIISGTTTGSSSGRLIDSNKTFEESLVGAIVYDRTSNLVTSVKGLINTTALSVFEDYFIQGESYEIHRPQSSGCVLYVGTGGNIKVTMIDGTVCTFANVPDGTFMPTHVLRVWSTGTDATDIIALW